VLANAVMAAVLLWLAGDLSQWLQWNALQRTGRLALLIGIGFALYAATLFLGGLRLSHLRNAGARA
jgi:peptidoglycan biosynthesis protein MviN/MurJ (putative lipid II flippase)